MPDYGIKTSRVGVNVETASNDDLSFTSSRISLKMPGPVPTTVTTSGGYPVGYRTIAHNLGFIPDVRVYFNSAGSLYKVPWTALGSGGVIFYEVDATSLVIGVEGIGPATFDFIYFISESESI